MTGPSKEQIVDAYRTLIASTLNAYRTASATEVDAFVTSWIHDREEDGIDYTMDDALDALTSAWMED